MPMQFSQKATEEDSNLILGLVDPRDDWRNWQTAKEIAYFIKSVNEQRPA